MSNYDRPPTEAVCGPCPKRRLVGRAFTNRALARALAHTALKGLELSTLRANPGALFDRIGLRLSLLRRRASPNLDAVHERPEEAVRLDGPAIKWWKEPAIKLPRQVETCKDKQVITRETPVKDIVTQRTKIAEHRKRRKAE